MADAVLVTLYNELIDAASAARLRVYAPDSGFQVGLALATKAGKIYGAAILKCKSLTGQNCYHFHRKES